eukprot:37606-Pleurochrysis_carterae.AAC.1
MAKEMPLTFRIEKGNIGAKQAGKGSTAQHNASNAGPWSAPTAINCAFYVDVCDIVVLPLYPLKA